MIKEVKIEDIYNFYKKYPEHKGKIKVETRFGFKPILACDITVKDSEVYEIKTKSGILLRTSPDHLLLSNCLKWIKVKDLRSYKNILFSRYGIEKIKYIKKLDYKEDLYDIQVQEVSEFYANDIVSHNSVLLSSIFFGLTGKPYRKIKKEKLINNINKRNLVVELETEHKGSHYLIKRGLNPHLFEIFKDGELVNEDSHVKDYQLQLETMMGFDYKTIKQTIVLSTRYYTPFLDLSAYEKREFIENIFSIKVFSDMNSVLKSKIQSNKLLIKDLNKDIERIKSNINLMEDLNNKQKQQVEQQKEDIEKEILKLEEKMQSLIDCCKVKEKDIVIYEEKIKALNERLKQKSKLEKELNIHEFKISNLEERIEFFNINDTCRLCNQSILEEFKLQKLKEYNIEKEMLLSEKKEFLKLKDTFIELSKQIQDNNQQMNEINKCIIENNTTATAILKRIQEKKRQHTELNSTAIINESDLEELKRQLEDTKKRKLYLESFLKYVGITIELLSEKGIKKFIIEKFVPIFNSILNKTLKQFEASFSVMFDNEFNETIIINGIEDQGYFSLSSGEKQRLDLAMLFSFVELCRIKNSVNTNLIFFDEILDASLDQSGIDGILKIFNDLKSKGYTIFNISHREGIAENFDKFYIIDKKMFSEITTY